MIIEKSTKKDHLNEIDDAVFIMIEKYSSIGDNKVNEFPYADSWTASQLLNHIEKSIKGIAQVMGIPSKVSERGVGERIAELKKIFLDFSNKINLLRLLSPVRDHMINKN